MHQDIAVAAAVQAAVGRGLNLLAIPLRLLINPVFASGPVLVVSVALSLLAFWRVPAKIDLQNLKFGMAGLVFGTALVGAVTFVIDSVNLTKPLGLLVILGDALALSGWSAPLSKRNLIMAGSGAGFLGTIVGVHGPLIVLLYQGLERNRVRGVILVFIGTGKGLSIIALLYR